MLWLSVVVLVYVLFCLCCFVFVLFVSFPLCLVDAIVCESSVPLCMKMYAFCKSVEPLENEMIHLKGLFLIKNFNIIYTLSYRLLTFHLEPPIAGVFNRGP